MTGVAITHIEEHLSAAADRRGVEYAIPMRVDVALGTCASAPGSALRG